tara:strand:- start:14 stop:238 length:225 start_codon:yes stop_codon:yes gene_type:complete
MRPESDGEYRFKTYRAAHYPGKTSYICMRIVIKTTELVDQICAKGERLNKSVSIFYAIHDVEARNSSVVPFAGN